MFGKKQKPTRNQSDLRAKAANRAQFTYYSSAANNPLQSRPGTNKPKTQDASIDLSAVSHRLRLLPTILALSVIVISLLISLTLSARPSVATLNNEPSPYHSLEEYAAAAEAIMSADLSSKAKFTINTHEVERKLLEQFPELKAAVIRLPIIGRKPNLVIDINSPAILLATPTKSYVLDNTGVAVSEVQMLSEESRHGLLVVQDQSGLPIELGKQAVTSETVAFISDAVAQLRAQNQTVSQLTLPQSANQLDIRLEGVPYYVKTDVSGNVRLQIGSFLAVKEKLEKDRAVPSEYVDVRVEEKVFYK